MKKEVYFKVGDKVTCLLFGYGIVEKVINTEDAPFYSIIVTFLGNNRESYTFDGRFRHDSNIVLFQGHVYLNDKLPQNKPLNNFEDGELVWLNTDHNVQNPWVTAYTEIDKTGRIFFRATFSQVLYGGSQVKEVKKFNDCPLKLNKNS